MKRISGVAAALLVCGASCFGTAQAPHQSADLGSLERALETTYHLHAQHVPMMGLVSGFTHMVSKGSVNAMQVVTYEDLPASLDHRAIDDLARTHLAADWSLMVRQASGNSGNDDLVFVQPAGKRIRMLVINLEANELNIVQMELSPEDLKKWKDEHGG